MEAGTLVRKKVEELFSTDPSGKHLVYTVLHTCLLSTVGFHVLSRTGHTNFTEAFGFKQNAILHASNPLKYQ